MHLCVYAWRRNGGYLCMYVRVCVFLPLPMTCAAVLLRNIYFYPLFVKKTNQISWMKHGHCFPYYRLMVYVWVNNFTYTTSFVFFKAIGCLIFFLRLIWGKVLLSGRLVVLALLFLPLTLLSGKSRGGFPCSTSNLHHSRTGKHFQPQSTVEMLLHLVLCREWMLLTADRPVIIVICSLSYQHFVEGGCGRSCSNSNSLCA